MIYFTFMVQGLTSWEFNKQLHLSKSIVYSSKRHKYYFPPKGYHENWMWQCILKVAQCRTRRKFLINIRCYHYPMREKHDSLPWVLPTEVWRGHHTLSRVPGQEHSNFKISQGHFLPHDFSEAAVVAQVDGSFIPSAPLMGLRAYSRHWPSVSSKQLDSLTLSKLSNPGPMTNAQ